MYRSRRFGRLLAAWLVLWFIAMSAAPLGPLLPAVSHSAESFASNAEGDVDDDGAEHHHHHEDEQPAQGLDAGAALPLDAHAGHGAGSLSHCPLCLHGAAPPPVVPASLAAAAPPAERPVQATHSVRRPRTDVPPPARGPPALS